ncbi:uncharacterized protein LOC111595742 [Drosophila hydei]|uniref:Uncharacterized protein LOC111595742 n=1 Tax=Drosophila hydei TaxID=7224 RepID=A0A6J1LGH8_DROHY|nr:uncharacterized protein LOC111595742 [Drosophila hydei]
MSEAEDEEAPEGEDIEAADEGEGEKGDVGAEEGIVEDKLDESEEDPFELLDESSEDNEEEKLMYREYLDLTKEIDCQNAIINDLKEQTRDLCENPCRTHQDKANLKKILICLDQEKIKLKTMIRRAIHLQNNGSKRAYGDIELATSFIEENLLQTSISCSKTIKYPSPKRKSLTAQQICDALEEAESESESEADCC